MSDRSISYLKSFKILELEPIRHHKTIDGNSQLMSSFKCKYTLSSSNIKQSIPSIEPKGISSQNFQIGLNAN